MRLRRDEDEMRTQIQYGEQSKYGDADLERVMGRAGRRRDPTISLEWGWGIPADASVCFDWGRRPQLMRASDSIGGDGGARRCGITDK